MKNTCKRVKSVISLKAKEFQSPKTVLNSKGEVLTNPTDIASFNIFFVLLHQTFNQILNKPLNLFIVCLIHVKSHF